MTEKPISQMNRFELDDLDKQIYNRRLELYAEFITNKGLKATNAIRGEPLEYVLVYSSALEELPNAWATVDECRRLLDTLANLEPVEAYRRWYPKVTEKYPSKPYTQADAIRDTRAAREKLNADYASGKIDGREYHDLYPTTNFMDIVE